jgi:hypothetical protein
VPAQNAPIDTALDAIRRAPFGIADILRRVQGDAVAAFGLGPTECPHQIVASGPNWRLRDYGHHETSHSLLIVAAPIKRPYIWDLTPSASAISYCQREGSHVHLLEWMPASYRTSNNGLDECARAISALKVSGRDHWLSGIVIRRGEILLRRTAYRLCIIGTTKPGQVTWRLFAKLGLPGVVADGFQSLAAKA